jgi:predicted nucleic acid-binding Zn ribbon protein
MEGILIFAAGAYVAAGTSNLKRERLGTLMNRSEGLKEFLEEQRSRQLAEGIWMMVVGAVIAVISVITFLV